MPPVARRVPLLGLALAALLLTTPSLASAQPAFSASFDPTSIGPGSAALVRFVIDNSGGGSPASGVGFSATLPAGVTFTSPAGASTTCTDALIDAPAGGSTLTLTGGRLGTSSTCTVSAFVTAAAPAAYTLTTGALSSSAGNSGTASATLTVATDRPGVSLSASPASVVFGGRTTLTYTFDNTANPSFATNLSLTHNLPTGVTVADPPRAVTDCGGVAASATPGGQSVGLTFLAPAVSVAAGASCTMQVDVRVANVGDLLLVTEPASARVGVSTLTLGRAASLVTATTDLALVKVDFLADPVAPGSTLELAYTLYNRDRNGAHTGLSFQHDLDATLTGLITPSAFAPAGWTAARAAPSP